MALRRLIAVGAIGLLISLPLLLSSHGASEAATSSGRPPVAKASAQLRHFTVHGQGSSKAARLNSAELTDLRRYAKQSGKSFTQLKASTFGQSEFAHAVHVLRVRQSAAFVASGHSRSARAPYWVRFTSRPDSKMIAPLRNLPTDTLVEYNSPLNVLDATELSAQVLAGLTDTLDVEAGTGGLNTAGDAVAVSYKPPPGLTDDELTAAENSVLNTIASGEPNGELPAPVIFTRDDSLATGENQALLQGGRNIVSW